MKNKLYTLLLLLITGTCFGQTSDTLKVFACPNLLSCGTEGYYINGTIQGYGGCTPAFEMHLAIIDSFCCLPTSNCNKNYGQLNLYYSTTCLLNDYTFRTCRNR